MGIHQPDLQELSRLALGVGKRAASFIATESRKPLEVMQKISAGSEAAQVVTAVDLGAQEIIIKGLQVSIQENDFGLLAEESSDDNSRLEKAYFWCIDPLDGTLPFTKGLPGYAVSIGLVNQAGESQIGVVCDPVTGVTWRAVRGQGVERDDKPWSGQSCAEDRLVFSTDRSFLAHPRYDAVVRALDDLGRSMGLKGVRIIDNCGGVLNACRTVEIDHSCYFKFPKKSPGGGSLWDYAASSCICLEAGRYVGDMHGGPLHLNDPETTYLHQSGVCYASDPALAEAILNIFKRSIGLAT